MEHYDALVRSYLQLIKTNSAPTSPPGAWGGGGQELTPPSSSLVPFNLLIQDNLHRLLQQHCKTASGALVNLLRSEFNLVDNVHVVQLFFLMEAGAILHHFTQEIFQSHYDNENWRDPAHLNATLDEAIHIGPCPQLDNHQLLDRRISCSCGGPLPCSLSLHYSTPWPLEVLLSEQVMGTYNHIFQLLLNIRWTKWHLEGISGRLGAIRERGRGPALKLHLLYLLRSRFLHFVNSLSYYLMTRVLHSVGAELRYSISVATDLESILSLHNTYITTISDHCFLNQKASMVYQAIVNVLDQGVRLRQCWERGVTSARLVREVEVLEEEFSRCCHFLVSCLNNTVQRSALPHLEALAFSLQTFKGAGKIFTKKTIQNLENS